MNSHPCLDQMDSRLGLDQRIWDSPSTSPSNLQANNGRDMLNPGRSVVSMREFLFRTILLSEPLLFHQKPGDLGVSLQILQWSNSQTAGA
mmetsp:Transcript_27303/g.106713  ORF Transcript_27303/g.106713 Transcript_27303/m.106713 type:complete len:90 (-) Transcript_27303:165-434(-)